MSKMCLKSASLDAGKDTSTPTPVDASVKSMAKKTKTSVEEETDNSYSEYTPLLYMKIDTNYYVKICVGGNDCIHVKFNMKGVAPELQSFQEGKKKSDKLAKF